MATLRYIDSDEAARMLGISQRRVRRLCAEGRFEGATRLGNNWAIPRVSVEHFERRRAGRPKAQETERTWLLGERAL